MGKQSDRYQTFFHSSWSYVPTTFWIYYVYIHTHSGTHTHTYILTFIFFIHMKLILMHWLKKGSEFAHFPPNLPIVSKNLLTIIYHFSIDIKGYVYKINKRLCSSCVKYKTFIFLQVWLKAYFLIILLLIYHKSFDYNYFAYIFYLFITFTLMIILHTQIILYNMVLKGRWPYTECNTQLAQPYMRWQLW